MTFGEPQSTVDAMTPLIIAAAIFGGFIGYVFVCAILVNLLFRSREDDEQ